MERSEIRDSVGLPSRWPGTERNLGSRENWEKSEEEKD